MTDLKGIRLKAIVVSLVKKMQDRDGWCGETHVQKTAYFLKDLMNVPIGYEFIIYKHGPYSFDLRDDLMAMKANRFLRTEARYPYRPSFRIGELSEVVTARYPKTLSHFEKQIDFIADELSNKDVKELERLGTALFITKANQDGLGVDERARLVNARKPHITVDQARLDVLKVDELREKAASVKLPR